MRIDGFCYVCLYILGLGLTILSYTCVVNIFDDLLQLNAKNKFLTENFVVVFCLHLLNGYSFSAILSTCWVGYLPYY